MAGAVILGVFYLSRNENLLTNLGPLGDFLSSNGKIVAGVVLAVMIIWLGVRGKLGKGKTGRYKDFIAVKGTVCYLDEEEITSKTTGGEPYKYTVYVPTIQYTIGSVDYRLKVKAKQGQVVNMNDEYTVYYNPRDPNDAYIKELT